MQLRLIRKACLKLHLISTMKISFILSERFMSKNDTTLDQILRRRSAKLTLSIRCSQQNETLELAIIHIIQIYILILILSFINIFILIYFSFSTIYFNFNHYFFAFKKRYFISKLSVVLKKCTDRIEIQDAENDRKILIHSPIIYRNPHQNPRRTNFRLESKFDNI